ncbi:MAG: hypothetical protein H6868_04975 [Rhodospirillales bacterium]|nr:hypothetical protein [Rhodospirillales bacterium]
MTALNAAQVKDVLAGFGGDIAGGVGTNEIGVTATGSMARQALGAATQIAGAEKLGLGAFNKVAPDAANEQTFDGPKTPGLE